MVNGVQTSNNSDAQAPGRVPGSAEGTAGLLAGAAAVWATAIPTAPMLAPTWPVGAALLYAAGALLCHQQPERSFHADGHQWLVCARCSGLYLGAAVGSLAGWGYQRRGPSAMWRRGTVLRALPLAALPTVATVLSAWLGLGDPSNVWRAGLAAPLGLVAGAVAVALLADRLK